MSLLEWLSHSKTRIRHDGVTTGLRESGYEFYIGMLRRLEPLKPDGENIFEKEWDLLVVLDSARVDAMQEVEAEYSFLDQPETLRSVGSASYQWMERTFTEQYADEMDATTYVTANHFADDFLEETDLFCLDSVWQYGWDEMKHTIPPRLVTDAAIRVGREHRGEFDRCIVHYMQPHFPSIPDPVVDPEQTADEPFDVQKLLWKKARNGSLDTDRLWDAYIENLRYVLDDLELLLENFEAETVMISADHANAFGEWGVYAHPNVPLDCLRVVPWYQTTSIDKETYSPPTPDRKPMDEIDMDERLQALGYK
ncbi:hypothetical protein [Natronorubrum sp. DTA28]|uniref:hypothetical protein n=1 Tax=Natronorubrum sp. DTA28 TaxID=3447019 RepID=UPI003F842C86